MRIAPLPGEELPNYLEGVFTGEIVEGGEKARLVMDLYGGRLAVPGPEAEFIFTQGSAYFRDLTVKKSSRRRPWIRMQIAELETLAPGMENYVAFLTNDRFLESKDLDEEDRVGTEVVRGVETTVYSSTADLDEMADVVGLSDEQVTEMRTLVGDEAHFKFWLDDQGFVRRMEMPASLPSESGGAPDEVVIQIELYDYDGSFDIEIPPPDEVVDA